MLEVDLLLLVLLLVWVQVQLGSRDSDEGKQGTPWAQAGRGLRGPPSAAEREIRMGAGTPGAHAAPSSGRPTKDVVGYPTGRAASGHFKRTNGCCGLVQPEQTRPG